MISVFLPCGCGHSFCFDKLVFYSRCAEHYVSEIDDPKILEAAKNNRESVEKNRGKIYVL